MAERIPFEIKPMPTLHGMAAHTQYAFIELLLLAEALKADTESLLKSVNLTMTQYNTLRILRGAGTAGLTCNEITDKLITHDPDVTRLTDRLEQKGLVIRKRSQEDRRRVCTTLTRKGLSLVESMDEPMARHHLQQMESLGELRVRQLRRVVRELIEHLQPGRLVQCPDEVDD